ncbi:MAG TPA: lipocalin family protein [Rubrivivax sp.]
MTSSAHTELPDLETRIAQAELAVVQRDQRIRKASRDVVARVESLTQRFLGPGLMTSAAAAALAGWSFLRRRPAAGGGAAENVAKSAPWLTLLPVVWPMLPAQWRRFVSPGTAAAVLGVALPVLGALWPARRPVQTVPQLDLRRYAGHWYEIARLPVPFESQCAGDATATYTLGESGVDVLNCCRLRNGRLRCASGVGRVVPGSQGAKLDVSLFPRWLRWLPFAWAGYWVIDVDAAYQTAVVGTPGRHGLWLLSRSPVVDEARLQRMVENAAAQGYRVAGLRSVPHST